MSGSFLSPNDSRRAVAADGGAMFEIQGIQQDPFDIEDIVLYAVRVSRLISKVKSSLVLTKRRNLEPIRESESFGQAGNHI